MSLLSLTTLADLITNLKKNQYECKVIREIFQGDFDIQTVNNNYKKILIKNDEDSIKKIIIECINETVSAITFYGKLNIYPLELLEKYKTYREEYSFRDELYIYFFNEDVAEEYKLSFFKSDNSKIDFDEKNISNMTIYFNKR